LVRTDVEVKARLRNQRICALTGIAMMVCLFVGFIVAGFLPPPSPHDSAAQIAAIFRDHTVRIRIGLVIAIFGAALLGPWVGVTTTQLKRAEGRHTPLAYTELALGAILVFEFVIPILLMEAGALRPGLPASTLRLIDDFGWLSYVGGPSTAMIEVLVIGVVILQEKRENPIFPRWAGWLSIVVPFLFAPGAFITFSTHGALAWNGVVAWWLGLGSFGVWIVAFTVALWRAIDHQAREEAEEVRSALAAPLTADATAGTTALAQVEALRAEVDALRAEVARASAVH
jgi:hypothetical protein